MVHNLIFEVYVAKVVMAVYIRDGNPRFELQFQVSFLQQSESLSTESALIKSNNKMEEN